MTSLTDFKEVWLVDFEFAAPSGAVPEVRCLVALEYFSGRKIRLWIDEIAKLNQPPYNIGKDALFIAYYATAEFNCHLALGWALPCYVLDLFVEFRNTTNGLTTPCGAGLVGALTYYGLNSIECVFRCKVATDSGAKLPPFLGVNKQAWDNQGTLKLFIKVRS